MQNENGEQRETLKWALPTSVALHVIAVLLLIFGLPPLPQMPEKEHAVKVELVPPPKPVSQRKPKPPTSKPPQPKKKEPPKSAPPPPPVDAAKRSKIPVLNPALHFGEKDAGPRRSLDGSTTKDSSPAEKAPVAADEKPPPAPPPMTVTTSSDQSSPSILPIPAQKPEKAREKTLARLDEAKKLFSTHDTGSQDATTAMGNTPRDQRIARLCSTELRDQLMHASSPYLADLLPFVRLEKGTVIDAPDAAFHSGDRWYALSYRCEVDSDATKVVSFAFRVGGMIPRSEWKERGFPLQ